MKSLHSTPQAPRRRLVLGALALPWLSALPGLGRAATQTVVNVLTSYPDEVMSRFETAFEQAYPQYRLRYLWRMPHDALPYLRKHARDGSVDVYWSASPRTFSLLKEEQLLRPLDVPRNGLPEAVGGTRISDADGYFLATEIAGYVFACDEARLRQLAVPVPRDWTDLATPRLQGRIALPVPSEVGFAPVMFDIVLQSYGWARGWALWSEIGALSRLARRGSTFITDMVGTGEVAIGLSMDFFVQAAIAQGARLSAHYPAHNGINPGHIAYPAVPGNPDGARAFATFILSDTGQRLLMHPNIRKLPVRPTVYPTKNMSGAEFNPFAAAGAGMLAYDNARGRWRLAIISAMFDEMVVRPHAELQALWTRVHAAEAQHKPVQHIRTLLGAPAIAEAEADSTALRGLFRQDLEGGPAPRQAMMQRWAAFHADQRAKANAALQALGT
ncbi:extracellular solute-binding protein [Imbroritus primus]|uniref:ABC transporter substrate-binding protein n=1 Tax=Imbroritus primus TaxID=3058603 RepID=UPI00026961E7